MTKTDILPTILQLPPAERLELLEQIQQSLDATPTTDQLDDLENRLEELESNPSAGDTWNNVMTRLRARP